MEAMLSWVTEVLLWYLLALFGVLAVAFYYAIGLAIAVVQYTAAFVLAVLNGVNWLRTEIGYRFYSMFGDHNESIPYKVSLVVWFIQTLPRRAHETLKEKTPTDWDWGTAATRWALGGVP